MLACGTCRSCPFVCARQGADPRKVLVSLIISNALSPITQGPRWYLPGTRHHRRRGRVRFSPPPTLSFWRSRGETPSAAVETQTSARRTAEVGVLANLGLEMSATEPAVQLSALLVWQRALISLLAFVHMGHNLFRQSKRYLVRYVYCLQDIQLSAAVSFK